MRVDNEGRARDVNGKKPAVKSLLSVDELFFILDIAPQGVR